MTRRDLTPETVAQEWLDGNTIETIAIEHETTAKSVRRRLKTAREMFPDLDWESRTVKPSDRSAAAYIHMADGRPGETAGNGSVLRSRALRRK